MSELNIMPQDSFERARAAFFGTPNKTVKVNAGQEPANTPHIEPAQQNAAELTAVAAS